MFKKRLLLLTMSTLLAMLLTWSCSQPMPGSPTGGEGTTEPAIKFNYELTGSFENTSSRAQSSYHTTKMKVTNLANGKVESHDWVVMIDKDAMTVTSYSSLVLPKGRYLYEILINAGAFQYYGRSEALEITEGANTIPLKIKPVIGNIISDISYVSDITDMALVLAASELKNLRAPRIGYIIDGAGEVIVNVNPKSGLSVLQANLSRGEHTIRLKLYDRSELVGTTLAGPEEVYNLSWSDKISAKIYPLYGECNIELPTGTGDVALIDLTLPAEISTALDAFAYGGRKWLEVDFTIGDSKNSFITTKLSADYDAAGKLKAKGTISDLGGFNNTPYVINVDVTLHFQDQVGPNSYIGKEKKFARATSGNIYSKAGMESVALTYRLFRGQVVDASIRSIVNLNVFNNEGHRMQLYDLYVDGVKVIEDATSDLGKAAVTFDVEPGLRKFELRYAKDAAPFKTFELNLEPLEVRNVSYTLPTSQHTTKVSGDSFSTGQPLPFDVVERGDVRYRVRAKADTVTVETTDASSDSWKVAIAPYTPAAGEQLPSKQFAAIDSLNRLNIVITDETGKVTKLLRLKAGNSAWETVALPANVTSYAILNDSTGAIYLLNREDATFILKLKSDDTGWETPYQAPELMAIEEVQFDGADRLHVMGKHIRMGNMEIKRYDATAKTWKELFVIGTIGRDMRFALGFDGQNRALILREYNEYFKDTATSGRQYYTYYVELYRLKAEGGRDKAVNCAEMRNDYVGFNSMVSHNDDVYLLINGVGRQPELCKVNGTTFEADTTFSKELPFMGYDFESRFAADKNGQIYLNYFDKQSGVNVFFKR